MSDKTVFHNPVSGETFVRWERADGTRDLKFGETGSLLPGHAVLRENGIPAYIRDTDGRVIADDKIK